MSRQDRKFFDAEQRGMNLAITDLQRQLAEIRTLKHKSYPDTQLASRMTGTSV
jgi:hypothetical protein